MLPAHTGHTNLNPYGIGLGLRAKVNANTGTSSDYGNIDTELVKLGVAIDSEASTAIDLW